MFLGCTYFQVTFPFTNPLIFNFRYYFIHLLISLCFLVLDHEAVPDLSLSVSLKSSMIMGTGLQIRLFLHDFYTRLYNTIVTYSFSLTLSLLMKTVKLHFRTHVHVSKISMVFSLEYVLGVILDYRIGP